MAAFCILRLGKIRRAHRSLFQIPDAVPNGTVKTNYRTVLRGQKNEYRFPRRYGETYYPYRTVLPICRTPSTNTIPSKSLTVAFIHFYILLPRTPLIKSNGLVVPGVPTSIRVCGTRLSCAAVAPRLEYVGAYCILYICDGIYEHWKIRPQVGRADRVLTPLQKSSDQSWE